MDFEIDEQQRLGIGLALVGAGSLIVASPTVTPVPQRQALYAGAVLLIIGVLVVVLNSLLI